MFFSSLLGPLVYKQALVFHPIFEIKPSNLPHYAAVVMFNAGFTCHHVPRLRMDGFSLRLACSSYDLALQNLRRALKN